MNMSSTLSTSPMAIVPGDKAMVVSAGIPLFELRKVKTSFVDPIDTGYFDVKVSEYLAEFSTRIQRSVTWYRGKSAYIRYYHDKKGMCTGYCPDDPDWFNRIKLASNINSGQFRILRYHTNEGFFHEKRITDEIMMLRDLIHEWRVEYHEEDGTRNGKWIRLDGFPTEEGAITCVKKQKAEHEKIRHTYGKTLEIRNLIDQFGVKWPLSPDFQNKVLVGIKKKIASEFGEEKQQGVNMEDQIAAALANMDPEKLAAIISKSQQINTGKEETIDDLDIGRLRSLCKTSGINSNGMNKEEMKEALKEHQKEKSADPLADNDNGEGSTHSSNPEDVDFN